MVGWLIASVVVSVIGAGAQAESQRKASSQRKAAQEIDARKTQIEEARARRKQVAEARAKRAEQIAQGEASGTAGSSAVAGATGALTAKTGGTLGFQSTLQKSEAARFSKLSQANTSMERADTAAAATEVGQAVTTAGYKYENG